MAEHVKEERINEDVALAFTTDATPGTKTTILTAKKRSGFRINAPLATADIYVYYSDYVGGDEIPFYKIPAGGNSVQANYIDLAGVARSYMGEVQVSSQEPSQPLSVVEYQP